MPRVQQKRGTASALASVNPTPAAGELVWDSTENAIKIGDGSTAWTSLAYVTATPRTHTHSADAITSGTVAYARLPVGSTASTVCAGDDSRLSDSRTPASHAHGNISNAGAIGTTSNLPVITGTNGILQAGSFGTAANTFCQGDDARLSDARTPAAHKASHATGGSDALTPADIGAAPAASPAFTGAATFDNTGNVVPLTITNTGTANSFVVNDETGDTTPFVVSAGGRVGILSPTPASALHVSHSDTPVAQFERLLSDSPTSGQGQQVAFSIGVSGATGSGVVFIHRSYDTTTATRISRNHIRMYDTGIAIEDGSSVDVVAFNTTNLESVFSGVILADDATSTSAPVYSFTGDQNCGIGHPAADTIALSTAGSERLRVDSSGRLGIGTTSLTATLDVNADTMRLRTARTPASASATGNAGDICWDADYLYIAVATNTWRRISHASW